MYLCDYCKINRNNRRTVVLKKSKEVGRYAYTNYDCKDGLLVRYSKVRQSSLSYGDSCSHKNMHSL